MARISAALVDSLPRDQLEALVLQVRREQAVRVRALGLGTLSRAAQAELLAELGRAGLEHTGDSIRVPLREQVRALVAQAGELGIAESTLAREVRGARNTAELRLCTSELIRDGELTFVADGRTPRLSQPGGHVLSADELDQLAALVQRLFALAKETKPSAGKPRVSLLRSALEPSFAMLRALSRPAALLSPDPRLARAPAQAHSAPLEDALRTAFLVAPAPSGLVRVPDVIRALEPAHPRAALVLATTQLARAGLFELRPEASIAGLTADDRARCPVALDGTPLSYARLTPAAQAAHDSQPAEDSPGALP